MPICSNCKAEYLKGKKFCLFCGEELYRGILTVISEENEQDVSSQKESKKESEELKKVKEPQEEQRVNEPKKNEKWVKITSVNSEYEADMIIRQLTKLNIPTMKRNSEIPFEDVSSLTYHGIDIYVPEEMEKQALEAIN